MRQHKQLFINLVAQILGFVVSIAISFFLTPYIVENIGEEAFGFVGLANNFVEYAQIIVVALNSMASRFITISIFQNKEKETNEYFSSVVFGNIFISIVLIIPIVWLLINLNTIVNIPAQIEKDVILLWLFIFLNFLVSLIGSSFGVATFTKNRLDLASYRMIEASILKAVILFIVFYFFKPAVWYVGFASLIFTLYSTLFNIYYTKKLLPQVSISFKHFNLKRIYILVSSGIWNSFNKLSSIMSTGLDLLITNLYIGASMMGLLSLSKTLPTVILSLFARISGVFSPQLTQYYAEGNIEEVKNQIIFSMKVLGVLSSIPMAGMFAFGASFYQLWVPNQDHVMLYWLTVVSSLAFVFSLPMEGLWNIFTITNHVKQSSLFLFFNSVITIIIVIVSLQFVNDINIRLFIIIGVSTIFSIIRSLTFLPMYGAHLIHLPVFVFHPVIFKNFISVLVLTIIGVLIQTFVGVSTWASLFFWAFVVSIIGLGLNSLIILNRSDRQKLISIFHRRVKARFG